MYILGGFDGRRLNDMSGSWMGFLAPRWGENDKDKRQEETLQGGAPPVVFVG